MIVEWTCFSFFLSPVACPIPQLSASPLSCAPFFHIFHFPGRSQVSLCEKKTMRPSSQSPTLLRMRQSCFVFERLNEWQFLRWLSFLCSTNLYRNVLVVGYVFTFVVCSPLIVLLGEPVAVRLGLSCQSCLWLGLRSCPTANTSCLCPAFCSPGPQVDTAPFVSYLHNCYSLMLQDDLWITDS